MPGFGIEPLLDAIAASPTPSTFVGARTRPFWPTGFDPRRVEPRDPTPVYPHSPLWHADNPTAA